MKDCPHLELVGWDHDRQVGKIQVDRRQGCPMVVVNTSYYLDDEGNMLDEGARVIRDLYSHTLDISPDDAIALGRVLIQVGEHCKEHPDMRKQSQ